MEEKRTITQSDCKRYLNDTIKGRDSLKVCYMAHNSSWPYYQSLARKNDNLIIDCHSPGLAYMTVFQNPKRDDYDLLIMDSNDNYRDDFFYELKELAQDISEKHGKKVTVGYSYYVSNAPEIGSHIEAIIITYDKLKSQGEYLIDDGSTNLARYLIELSLEKHDHFEPHKVYTKK